MSFRSQDGLSHPWVRRLGRYLFCNHRVKTLDESVEDSVILLRQSSFISFWTASQLKIVDIGLKGHVKEQLPCKTEIVEIYPGSKYIFLTLLHILGLCDKPNKNCDNFKPDGPPSQAEVQGNLVTSSEYYGSFAAVLDNNENYSSNAESLPNLDELLGSCFNSDFSDNKEEVGGQENADP